MAAMAARGDGGPGTGRPSGEQLSETAYQRIRRMIVECELAPGSAISQSRLQATIRLGVAAVRTALARLQQEGLVRPLPRRGYLISPVTPQDIHELLDLRLLLEPASLRLAAGRLTAAEIAALRRLATIGYDSRSRESERRFLRANRDFHMIIARASGNERLVQVLEQIFNEASRMLYLTMSASQNHSETWQAGHRALCDALERGDGETAVRIAEGEINEGRTAILTAVLARPGIARLNVFGS
jgi:DNA-binding GntR family transcriptional regulator